MVEQARYQNQPLEFVRIIQNCLLKEQQLVEHHDTMGVSLLQCFVVFCLYYFALSSQMQDTANPNPVLIIDRGLQQVTQMTDKLEADYRVLHSRQEQFVLRYQEVIKLDGMVTRVLLYHVYCIVALYYCVCVMC